MEKPEIIINKLIEKNLVSESQLMEIKSAMESTGKGIEEIIIDYKIIDSEVLTKIKAEIASLPYRNLIGRKMSEEVLMVIPLEVAENYKIVCFSKEANKIKVGITDPSNFKAIEAVDFLAKEEGYVVEYYLISELSFNITFKQYRTLRKEISSALKTKAEEEAHELAKIKKKEGTELEEVTKTAPVAKIVSVIIRHAVDGRASDIHIEPLPKESRVRYRIDGILGTSLILPKNVHGAIVGRIKVMANLKLDETRMPQDGRIKVSINDKEIDLRVSTLPLLDEEKVVMRILDMSKKVATLEDLGFIGWGLDTIKNNIKKKDGMLLVTGPTGSGKSTTLFSILSIINKEGINISTLEDPVEYSIKGVNQSQIKPEIGFTFASGLRSILRQDPDIIMVGEIRDNETAELAIHAGLTGHYVLSTLHTNDALGAIPRLLDMHVEPFLLGSTLNTLVAQRLLRRICRHCKKEDKLPKDSYVSVEKEIKGLPAEVIEKFILGFNKEKLVFYKGEGCSRCGNTGYSGRLVVAEVVDINKELVDIIIEGKRSVKIEDVKASQKFITIRQDSVIKVLLGLTTVEEIIRVLYD